jgi:GNAT superfamily N-acetyltransferase
MQGQITVAPMVNEEPAQLEEWAAEEGWNPGLHDVEIIRRIEPDAFLALKVDDVMIGGAVATLNQGHFGFTGLFVVQPHLRGQGYGSVLWQALAARLDQGLSPGASRGLEGNLEMLSFYSRQGYALDFRHIRYQGAFFGIRHPSLVDLASVPLEDIVRFDARHVPSVRAEFIQAWIQQSGAVALGILEEGVLTGYGVARPTRMGYKVGPLFAEDVFVAERILSGLAEGVWGARLQIDVPEVNSIALEMIESLGFERVFDCGRMYSGIPPVLPLQHIFGTTSLEFG